MPLIMQFSFLRFCVLNFYHYFVANVSASQVKCQGGVVRCSSDCNGHLAYADLQMFGQIRVNTFCKVRTAKDALWPVSISSSLQTIFMTALQFLDYREALFRWLSFILISYFPDSDLVKSSPKITRSASDDTLERN